MANLTSHSGNTTPTTRSPPLPSADGVSSLSRNDFTAMDVGEDGNQQQQRVLIISRGDENLRRRVSPETEMRMVVEVAEQLGAAPGVLVPFGGGGRSTTTIPAGLQRSDGRNTHGGVVPSGAVSAGGTSHGTIRVQKVEVRDPRPVPVLQMPERVGGRVSRSTSGNNNG